MYVLSCSGQVSILADGAPTCSVAWTLQSVPEPFDLSQLDPQMMSAAFMAGFTIIGSFALIGWAARKLLSLLS